MTSEYWPQYHERKPRFERLDQPTKIMTTKTRIPAHMTEEQYNALVESCYDEETGLYDEGMMESLGEMIELSLLIEKYSDYEQKAGWDYADVSLDIEKWDVEFVCTSGDMVFRKYKDHFIFGMMCPMWKSIGILDLKGVFLLLIGQRRLEAI